MEMNLEKMEQNVLIAPVNLVFQHEQCMFWERKQEMGDFREINAPVFNVFPTSVLIWMALRSFSHISLICLVLVWITSILLWPSLSSLDANSFKETTLECPRGLISLTKSLNFFSSTCRINGDTFRYRFRYKNFCLPLGEKHWEGITFSALYNTNAMHCNLQVQIAW